MKWRYGPKTCPSHGWYADSDCGRWRITISTEPDRFALLDRKADYRVVKRGTKDECKREAEGIGERAVA